MGFAEGRIEGDKVFDGKVFPKTYLADDTTESGRPDLAAVVSGERESLWRTLEQHGAILLRGFRVESTADFSRVVEAFGWEELPYEGAANRIKKADRIYTANEIPLDIYINFHHEMALIKAIPSKVFFCCLQPSPEGGQTSIVPSDVIVLEMERRQPEVVRKLAEFGMTTMLHAKNAEKKNEEYELGEAGANKVWHRMLKTDDEIEAEKRALEKLACNSVKFNANGSADFFYGPMNPIRHFGEKRVWFNTILGYATDERDAYVSFSDGSPLPLEALEAYAEILEENCVDVSWQKGDVLVVDNLSVQHARRPGKPPRKVLVSLCK